MEGISKDKLIGPLEYALFKKALSGSVSAQKLMLIALAPEKYAKKNGDFDNLSPSELAIQLREAMLAMQEVTVNGKGNIPIT